MLDDIKQRIIDRKNYFELNGKTYSAKMLMDAGVIDLKPKGNFLSIMESLISERRLKSKTCGKYRYAFKKVKNFIGTSDFLLEELTVGFMKDFLKSLDVSDSTKRDICSCVASCWNYAIGRKIVDAGEYPFNEFKFTSKYKNGERDYFIPITGIKRLNGWMKYRKCTLV